MTVESKSHDCNLFIHAEHVEIGSDLRFCASDGDAFN